MQNNFKVNINIINSLFFRLLEFEVSLQMRDTFVIEVEISKGFLNFRFIFIDFDNKEV